MGRLVDEFGNYHHRQIVQSMDINMHNLYLPVLPNNTLMYSLKHIIQPKKPDVEGCYWNKNTLLMLLPSMLRFPWAPLFTSTTNCLFLQ